jgi:subtilisin family serine protease
MKKTILFLFLGILISLHISYATLDVSFNPNPINLGGELDINIDASDAFYYRIYIYDVSNRMAGYIRPSCLRYNKCKSQTINVNFDTGNPSANMRFYTDNLVSGKYSLRIYDYGSPRGWKKFYFDVGGGIEPKLFNISLSPDPVIAGDDLYLNITPGNKGIYKRIYFYTEDNKYKKAESLSCSSYKCFDHIVKNVNIPNNWANGKYYVKIYDYSETNYRNRWKKFYFNIVGGVEPRPFNVSLWPNPVALGEKIHLNITPGTEGIYKRIYFYTEDNKYKKFEFLNCSSYKCFNSFINNFEIPYVWESGRYYVKIYDYSETNYRNRWKKFYFNITWGACRDSDGGQDYYTKGNVSYGGSLAYIDHCLIDGGESTYLYEYSCSSDGLITKIYRCNYGCKEGVCEEPSKTSNFVLGLLTDEQATLRFFDGEGHLIYLPFAYSNGTGIYFGRIEGVSALGVKYPYYSDLITYEGETITRNDYFIVTVGNRSYALRYKGADKVTNWEQAYITFYDLGRGKYIDERYDSSTGAELKIGGNKLKIIAASDDTMKNFDIFMDLNGDGLIGSDNIYITDIGHATMNLDNSPSDFILNKKNGRITLEFLDNEGNSAVVPLLYSDNRTIEFGNNKGNLLIQEGAVISKRDYFIVTVGNSSYALRYRGADRVAIGEQSSVEFDEFGTGKIIEANYDPLRGAVLKLGGNRFKIIAASDDKIDDFDIFIDLNGDGSINNDYVKIISSNEKSLYIEAPYKSIRCNDSDGGVNYFEKGLVKEWQGDGEYLDECLNEKTLLEYSCEDGYALAEKYNCSMWCTDGSCIHDSCSYGVQEHLNEFEKIIHVSTSEQSKGFELDNLSDNSYDGYIFELKDKSVLEEKKDTEKEIIKIVKEIKTIDTSGFKILYNGPRKFFKQSKLKGIEKNFEKNLKKHEETIKGRQSKIKKSIAEIIKKSAKNQQKRLVVDKEFRKTFNGLVIKGISEEEVKKIAELREVKNIYPDLRVEMKLNESVGLIKADSVWDIGYTGKNITIAIIDTGVDYTHPDLGGCFGDGCKVVGGYDITNDDEDPMDDQGHGTHVAGIAAGNGILKGVAPDAKLYAYKVLDEGGRGFSSNTMEGIERAVDPNQDGNFSDHVDIISMSLGAMCGMYSDKCGPDDASSRAIDNAVDAGVIAVIAAGNSGPSLGTINSPGTARKAITVGATTKNDELAYFSSRGPVVWDGGLVIKPDVVAPGVNICSAQYDSILDWKKCYDDQHIFSSGTSMATPHVAGAAALILEANPSWTPEEIKNAMMLSAKDIYEKVNAQGAGLINIEKAIDPGLFISPLSLYFNGTSGQLTLPQKVTITNNGDQEVELFFKVDCGIANLNKQGFVLVPGASDDFEVFITNLPDGEGKIIGNIYISSSLYNHKIPYLFQWRN